MDSIFFWLSKLIWAVIAPDILLLILLTVTVGLIWLGRFPLAKTLLAVLVTGMWLLAVLPIGHWLLYPLEARFQTNPDLPEQVDGIIMLGGSEKKEGTQIWDQVELKEYSERALMFMFLARKYPDAKLVFSGGSGDLLRESLSEADVAKRLFQEQGLDVSRIVFEGHSRNTFENVVMSKQLVNPKQDETWVLITSASHIPRAVGVFRKIAWPVLPYPVDHQTSGIRWGDIGLAFAENLQLLTLASREWVGLLAYYLTGKTSELYPKSGEMKL